MKYSFDSQFMESIGDVGEPETLVRPRRGVEVTLADFVRPVWRGRLTVALVAILSACGAIGFTLSLRPRYEAVAIMRVIESKSAEQAEPARAENFRPLLENKTIASGLIKEFGIRRSSRFKWGGSAVVHPDTFVGDVLGIDQVAGTNLLRVRVTLDDPDLAARVANVLMDRAIDLNRRINQQEVIEARDFIKSQLDEARTRVEQVRTELVATKQRWQADALRSDVDGALEARGRLLQLQASIEDERAFLARSEADLGKAAPLVTTRRSIDRDPALMESAREQSQGASVLGLQMRDEQLSGAYEAIQQQAARSRAALAGLEGQRRLLVEQKRLDRTDLPSLTKLYSAEAEVARLDAEYEMVLKVYTDLAVRYEDARIRVGGRGVQLQVVDPAVPPRESPGVGVIAVGQLGLVLGALASTAVLLTRHFLVPLVQD